MAFLLFLSGPSGTTVPTAKWRTERSRPFPAVTHWVYNLKTVGADIIRPFFVGQSYNPSVIFGDSKLLRYPKYSAAFALNILTAAPNLVRFIVHRTRFASFALYTREPTLREGFLKDTDSSLPSE